MNKNLEPLQDFNESREVEIDLLQLFQFYLSKLVFIFLALFAGALISGLFTHFLIRPKYTASVKIYMVSASNDSVVDLSALNLGTALSSDYEVLMTIRPILNEVIDDLGLDYTYEDLGSMISINALNDTRIIQLSVKSTIPEEAARIANELADKAVTYLPGLMETTAPHIAERAIPPEKKSSPSLSRNALIGALLFAFLYLAYLTIRFLMDDTMKKAEDVEKEFGVMPLAVVPEGDIPSLKTMETAEERPDRKGALK